MSTRRMRDSLFCSRNSNGLWTSNAGLSSFHVVYNLPENIMLSPFHCKYKLLYFAYLYVCRIGLLLHHGKSIKQGNRSGFMICGLFSDLEDLSSPSSTHFNEMRIMQLIEFTASSVQMNVEEFYKQKKILCISY